MSVPSQTVLFVGGRGERLMPLTADCPKPMVPIHGKPFLEYLIEQLRGGGVERFLLLAGYRGEQIARHFANVRDVATVLQPPEWETGKRLKDVASLLDERFLLLYGDNFAPVSLPWLAERHAEAGKALTMTVCPKAGCGNVVLHEGSVAVYRNDPNSLAVDVGYMTAERDRLLPHLTGGSFSETLAALTRQSQLDAFTPGCFYHSISDPARLELTAEYLRPKKVILLDRDGVLNEKAAKGEYVTRPEDFRWIEENVAALQELARHGFTFVVLTNQAGIGRGMVSREAVDWLHDWMTDELQLVGVTVLNTIVCPHHWDDNCRCRKPLPGMFFEAAKWHDIRLDRTVYVGDDERDKVAAMRAGCGAFVQLVGGNTLCPSAVLDTFKEWGMT